MLYAEILGAGVLPEMPEGATGSHGWLVFYVVIALGVSALCSVIEAVFLSVTPAFAKSMSESRPRASARLLRQRENPDRPLSAILTLNTVAHTVGASGVGSEIYKLYGNEWVALGGAIMTVLILVLSEIIPKTVGAVYWKRLAAPTSMVIRSLVIMLKPVLVVLEVITKSIVTKKVEEMSREEVLAFAQIVTESKMLRPEQRSLMNNAIELDSVKVRDIMTPRTVVFSLPESDTLEDHRDAISKSSYSRIPLNDAETGDWSGFVLQTDLLVSENKDIPLADFKRPLPTFYETQPIIAAFRTALRDRSHIGQVVNEYGDCVGVVTLEDFLESVIGEEIVDESDEHIDLQVFAKQQFEESNGSN